MRAAAGAVIAAFAAGAGTQAGLGAPAPTPFPPIAARKTECPKVLFKVSGPPR